MTVKDTIALLQELPQDLEIVTAKDDEGNGFRKVPNGWISVERFDGNMDIIADEDYHFYVEGDLKEYVCIG